MVLQLSVKNQSIETSGITNDYRNAVCEYIWNGFEANATEVKLEYTINSAYGIESFSIIDNGEGICYEDLTDTFGTFLASQKNLFSLKMKSKTNKGKGRFSFVTFASTACWQTVYQKGTSLEAYEIVLQNEKKEIINCTEPKEVMHSATGTKVSFSDIFTLTAEDMSIAVLEPVLLKEFAWFLHLFKNQNKKILVNGVELDYKKYINTELSVDKIEVIQKFSFKINVVVWQESIKEKFCCYYLDENNVVKGKDTTTFNRNTVDFNHSVFIISSFFDGKENIEFTLGNAQMSLFENEDNKKIYRQLKKCVASIIEQIMGTYMTQRADDAIRAMMEERNTFPEFPDDMYGEMQKRDLERVTKEIYKLEPKIFYRLKPIQEKSLLGFLNLILKSEERENVLTIIEQIVELSSAQRKDFADILQKTKLENIIDSIKFIENRYKVIELLKTIVFDLGKFTNERDHIQKIVEQHFWLFGEQYNLASADQRMRTALEKYINILYGERNINVALNEDAEQERRMDIFLCNSREVETSFGATKEENIIVELKAPRVPLSKTVLRQIEDYMDYIRRQPALNSKMRNWKFIAVCKEVSEDVKSRYESLKDKGKVGLVVQIENYEVYAYTWDDVFKMFDLRHSPLLKRLKYNQEQLATELFEEVSDVEGREKVNRITDMVEMVGNVS